MRSVRPLTLRRYVPRLWRSPDGGQVMEVLDLRDTHLLRRLQEVLHPLSGGVSAPRDLDRAVMPVEFLLALPVVRFELANA